MCVWFTCYPINAWWQWAQNSFTFDIFLEESARAKQQQKKCELNRKKGDTKVSEKFSTDKNKMRPIQDGIWWQVYIVDAIGMNKTDFYCYYYWSITMNEREIVYKYAFEMAFHSFFTLAKLYLQRVPRAHAHIQLYMAQFDSMLKSCYLISIALTIELNACLYFSMLCTGHLDSFSTTWQKAVFLHGCTLEVCTFQSF